MKFLLLAFIFGTTGITGLAQGNGKQKSKQPNNFSWGESGGQPTNKVKKQGTNANTQSANRSSGTQSANRSGSQKQLRAEDSILMIKSPKTRVKNM
ncbi:MAG: hypothetical protein IPI66_03810 [Chitinophagaceae bacterium]|nr:hypothetical protein [Chitinophagaceae bacterium]